MIIYAEFTVQVHSLRFKSKKDLLDFGEEIRRSIEDIHPYLESEVDVSVDLEEYAGTPDE